MATKLTIPNTVFDTVALDSTNALYPLLSYASFVGIKANRKGNTFEMDGLTDQSKLTVATVQALDALGVTIEGYPVFIGMDDTVYGQDVPAYVPKSSYADENQQTVNRKWNEWKDSTHNHSKIGSTNYVPGNAYGVELKGDVISQLATAGYTILTPDEYVALLP